MTDGLVGLSYLYEIGTIIGIIFIIYSLYLITRIKRLFPGGKIVQKWRIMQLIVLLLIIVYIVDWIVWIVNLEYDLQNLLYVLGGIIRLSTGVFIALIIILFHRTYKLVLPQSKPEQKRQD